MHDKRTLQQKPEPGYYASAAPAHSSEHVMSHIRAKSMHMCYCCNRTLAADPQLVNLKRGLFGSTTSRVGRDKRDSFECGVLKVLGKSERGLEQKKASQREW
jgi:hypothetical protein